MAKKVLGIDIGKNTIKLALNQRGKVSALKPISIPDSIISNSDFPFCKELSELIKTALKQLKIDAKHCALVLPAADVFVRKLTLPVMTASQLDANLPFEFRDYISENKELYIYDYAVSSLADQDPAADTINVLAAAVSKATIDKYHTLLSNAGLKLKLAMPAVFAYRNIYISYCKAGASDELAEYGILDFGHSSCRISIYNKDMYETTREIEYSGKSLDRLFASHNNAESPFSQSGLGNVALSDDPKTMYNKVSIEVIRAINFIRYNNPSSNLNTLFSCGGLLEADELCAAIKNSSQLIINPIHVMLPMLTELEYAQVSAAAIGAVLQ